MLRPPPTTSYNTNTNTKTLDDIHDTTLRQSQHPKPYTLH